ncbi:MAG: phage integrase N-terminal SAM-like domain-containing protein [Calothrix sp. MO_167.B12]|nr:phage integrase N-terminal SAM-like domain-containing protein [Calothrix sp. MO_167.B12]
MWFQISRSVTQATRKIEAFLTHLAINENVAASTQNQVLNAILFLYKEVLKQDLNLKIDPVRPTKSKYLPTVLTKDEDFIIINQQNKKSFGSFDLEILQEFQPLNFQP